MDLAYFERSTTAIAPWMEKFLSWATTRRRWRQKNVPGDAASGRWGWPARERYALQAHHGVNIIHRGAIAWPY
ncbi:hypothetical protein KCP71_01500 [Salmonella enterica subsp. enterica]|nr:hypothetical protein KCP71_01500 [Salmonella enterica subsp. enterica]